MPFVSTVKKRTLPCYNQQYVSIASAALATLLLSSGSAQAIDIDVGGYSALPPGTNLAEGYYYFTTRDALYPDGNKAPVNVGLDSHTGILRGVHFTAIGGYTVDPQFLLPVSRLEGKDDTSDLGDTSGVGDLILPATVWLLDEPENSTYFGITPCLYIPTGINDREDPLNLGGIAGSTRSRQVRYRLTPDISLDLAGDVTIYGENDKFGGANATLKQDQFYQFQGGIVTT